MGRTEAQTPNPLTRRALLAGAIAAPIAAALPEAGITFQGVPIVFDGGLTPSHSAFWLLDDGSIVAWLEDHALE